MNQPLVSVIMPVKNGEQFLRESINSILQQDYPSIEIIIVDGQSTDNTKLIAASFNHVQYIYQENNPGIPYAKNLGIENAKGEFIAFISHDDLWAPQKLTKQINCMILNKLLYTITRVKFFLEPGCTIKPGFNKALLLDDYVGKMPETLVAHKSLFNLVGKFDTKFNNMEDIDWFNRAAQNNVPMAVIEEVLLYKRIHDSNESYNPSKIKMMKNEIFRILKESIKNNSVINSK